MMAQTPHLNILLADDQKHVRSALKLLLEQEPAVRVCGEAADATALLLTLERQAPDVLCLDWDLPGLPIHHLVRLLRFEHPTLRIVAMSSRPEDQLRAREAGAAAYLSKGSPPEVVLATLRAFLPPSRRRMEQNRPDESHPSS